MTSYLRTYKLRRYILKGYAGKGTTKAHLIGKYSCIINKSFRHTQVKSCSVSRGWKWMEYEQVFQHSGRLLALEWFCVLSKVMVRWKKGRVRYATSKFFMWLTVISRNWFAANNCLWSPVTPVEPQVHKYPRSLSLRYPHWTGKTQRRHIDLRRFIVRP